MLHVAVAIAAAGIGGGFRNITIFVDTPELDGAAKGSQALVEPKSSDHDTYGTWHGQSGQDRTIAKLFEDKRNGYFVDLASNEPIYLSNTRALE